MDFSPINEWGGKLYQAILWCINLLPKMFETDKSIGGEVAKGINEPNSAEAFGLLVFAIFVLITYAGIKRYFDPARNIFAFFGIILIILVLVALLFLPSTPTI